MSNTRHATVTWTGGLRFESHAPQGPSILLDGDGKEGPSPVVSLLMAAAACAGSDVVIILEKMRVRLDTFRMEASGVRREQEPRRFLSMHLVFHLAGQGLDETKARRAIDLSIEKYCSVMHSLAADLRITYDLELA